MPYQWKFTNGFSFSGPRICTRNVVNEENLLVGTSEQLENLDLNVRNYPSWYVLTYSGVFIFIE